MSQTQASNGAGPLGLQVARYGDEPRSVIGEITISPAGNVILRIGRENPDRPGWHQTELIVLDETEAGELAARLIAVTS